jgi:hypothetical protein
MRVMRAHMSIATLLPLCHHCVDGVSLQTLALGEAAACAGDHASAIQHFTQILSQPPYTVPMDVVSKALHLRCASLAAVMDWRAVLEDATILLQSDSFDEDAIVYLTTSLLKLELVRCPH